MIYKISFRRLKGKVKDISYDKYYQWIESSKHRKNAVLLYRNLGKLTRNHLLKSHDGQLMHGLRDDFFVFCHIFYPS